MKNWILAARPKTLTAALVPIVVASSLAKTSGLGFHLDLALWALMASFFIQIGTNLVNDAVDFHKGTDTVDRIGPVRVTASGLVEGRVVMRAAWICFGLAFLCGIPLVQAGGAVILAIGLVSIFFGYAYTGGPYPLAYHGLGDFFVVVFFGLVAVSGMFYLHTQQFIEASYVAGLQVGFLAAVLIGINNLRDIEGDRLNHKKTLAVRFGKTFARYKLKFLIFSPYFIGIYWLRGMPTAFILPLGSLPLAIYLSRKIARTEPSPIYNKFLAQSALLHLLFGLLLSVGFLIS